jgi:hypothetical protein
MTTGTQAPGASADFASYAESLYRYAGAHLDPFSLRCWIIQRLMLDHGLEHRSAKEIYESVRAQDVGTRR